MLSLVEHRKDGKLALHGLSFTLGVLISMTLLAGALIAVKAAGVLRRLGLPAAVALVCSVAGAPFCHDHLELGRRL